MSNKRFFFEEEEKKIIKEILIYYVKQKQYSERCLGHFLHTMKSEKPLVDILGRHQDRFRDIQIQYGKRDWMDSAETIKVLKSQKWDSI